MARELVSTLASMGALADLVVIQLCDQSSSYGIFQNFLRSILVIFAILEYVARLWVTLSQQLVTPEENKKVEPLGVRACDICFIDSLDED